MSASASAKVVVGIKFEDIGRTFQEERELTQYEKNTGKPYQIEIEQRVVEILGQRVPDEPDADRPVWSNFSDDPRRGTRASYNLYRWLLSRDERWGDEETVTADFKVLGVNVAYADGDYNSSPSEIGDYSKEIMLAKELLASIGYTGQLKLCLVAYLH